MFCAGLLLSIADLLVGWTANPAPRSELATQYSVRKDCVPAREAVQNHSMFPRTFLPPGNKGGLMPARRTPLSRNHSRQPAMRTIRRPCLLFNRNRGHF